MQVVIRRQQGSTSKTKERELKRDFKTHFVESAGEYLKEELDKYKDIKVVVVENKEQVETK